jgi:hypothetical protein
MNNNVLKDRLPVFFIPSRRRWSSLSIRPLLADDLRENRIYLQSGFQSNKEDVTDEADVDCLCCKD